MALLACPLAFGQSTPAATSWQKYPTAVPSSPLPPPPPLPGTSVGGASTPGSRVVVFTKPAGEVQPVQATAPVQKDDQKEPKAEDKLLKDDKLQAEKEAKLPTPPPADPFGSATDFFFTDSVESGGPMLFTLPPAAPPSNVPAVVVERIRALVAVLPKFPSYSS